MKKFLTFWALIVMVFTVHNANAWYGGDCPAKKVLVAYFSATGNTAKVAEEIYNSSKKHKIQTDLFEIKPEKPYTDADLDWRNDNSRSSIEMKNSAFRPVIATKVENMDKYDVVFIGFPIWWGREPSIIDTFLESYNFSGKEIVPFATSGSSDIGEIYKNIELLAPKAYVDKGKRFPTNTSSKEEKEAFDSWVSEYVVSVCL